MTGQLYAVCGNAIAHGRSFMLAGAGRTLAGSCATAPRIDTLHGALA